MPTKKPGDETMPHVTGSARDSFIERDEPETSAITTASCFRSPPSQTNW